MRIEQTRTLSDEFVLNVQHLQDICDTMLKQMSLVANPDDIVTDFKLTLQDLKYGYEAVSEGQALTAMLAEDNGDAWIIQKLEIKLSDRNRPDFPRISLEFRKQELELPFKITLSSPLPISISSTISNRVMSFFLLQKSIEYDIVGDDRDWIYQTCLKLEEKIAKIRQFSFKLTGSFLVLSVFFLALLGVGFYFSPTINFKLPVGLVILAGFVLFLLASLGITFLSYFPPYNFCWGEYKKTFDKKHALGKSIIYIIIVSLAVSVIGSVIGTLILIK